MKSAKDRFDDHLRLIRKTAEKKGMHVADLLKLLIDENPHVACTVPLVDPALSNKLMDLLLQPLVEQYRPQYYEWIADQLARKVVDFEWENESKKKIAKKLSETNTENSKADRRKDIKPDAVKKSREDFYRKHGTYRGWMLVAQLEFKTDSKTINRRLKD